MTFRPIARGGPRILDGMSATPSDSIRLNTYRMRSGGRQLLIIWLGDEVAQAIRLHERRHMVSVLTDGFGSDLKVAIDNTDGGEFCAAKKLRAYSVHLDAGATKSLLGDHYVAADIIGPDDLVIDGKMVSFAMPPLVKRGSPAT